MHSCCDSRTLLHSDFYEAPAKAQAKTKSLMTRPNESEATLKDKFVKDQQKTCYDTLVTFQRVVPVVRRLSLGMYFSRDYLFMPIIPPPREHMQGLSLSYLSA